MIDEGLEHERNYVTGLYSLLDDLIAQAQQRLDEVRAQGGGGTHQGRTERDTFARLYEDRIAQLREVTERLAFGRLLMTGADAGAGGRGNGAGNPTPADHVDTPADTGQTDTDQTDTGHTDIGQTDTEQTDFYIGRIGLRDAEQRPVLLDWRVPQASPFYQATSATPMGARARRHLISRGREVVRVEDEIFDSQLLDGRERHEGGGALLAALDAERTGRMNDIVATIQAEQDRIIRSALGGILVVQGGPGTGKTAVALHRAAYLLYTHRRRLGSSGVLIVGPSASFLHYIESVLPSLGETGVVLQSLGTLVPGYSASLHDAPEVAELKGRPMMAELLARAVRSRQRVPAAPIPMSVSGDTVVLDPATVERAIARARESRKPYNEARVVFVRTALAELTSQWAADQRARGATIDSADLRMLQEDLRTAHDVKVALNTAWLPLTPRKLLDDLFARPQWLAELTPDWSPERRALLRRERGSALTVEDIPLIDEAAELLGEYDAADAARQRADEQQRARDIENAEAAIENMGVEGFVDARTLAEGFSQGAAGATTAERAAADRTWTYAHVVVDEAQELSPMQWRVLLRRCPLRSFTIVGDIAQRSAAGAAPSWGQAIRTLVGRSRESERWRLEELTVNYRTPGQIAEVAQQFAVEHNLPITMATSVRSTQWPVEQMPDVVSAVERMRGDSPSGTLAVITHPDRLNECHAALSNRFGGSVGFGSDSLLTPIVVMPPQEAKGLEFDLVVVEDPGRIAAEPRGANALYVAMTRATQRLALVGELPRAA